MLITYPDHAQFYLVTITSFRGMNLQTGENSLLE